MHLENILPYEQFTLISKLSKDEVRKRISDNIEHRKGLQFSLFRRSSLKPYEGQIFGDSFKINRIIQYRNSFLPIVTGNISTFPGKTHISVKMKLANVVLIFVSIWLGVVGLVCLGMFLALFLQFQQFVQKPFSPELLIPFGMFAFGCLLTTLSFKYESKKTKKFLTDILEAQEKIGI